MLPEMIKLPVFSFLGTLGFCLLFHFPKRAILPAALLGAFTYLLCFILTKLGLSSTLSNLLAAATGSIFAHMASRKMKIIATAFIIASMIPLVPGLGLYECMAMLATGDTDTALQLGISTMKIVLMLALGMGVGSFVFTASPKRMKHKA